MTVYTAVRPTTDCGPRIGGKKPNIVVLHHTAGVMSIDALVGMMMPGGRTVSAHAAIKDRDIVSVVPESKRAFALADSAFDSRALNAECINSTGGPNWQLSDATHESIARWVADVCKRHGIRPHRSGAPKTWTVIGHREVYSIHRAGYATACPGGMRLDWIVKRAQQLLEQQPTPTPPAPKPGPTTDTPTEESTVSVKFGHRKGEKTDEWMIVHPELDGGDGKQLGYLVTADPDEAKAWSRLYRKGWVTVGRYDFDLPRADYVELQAAARRVHRAWKAAQAPAKA